MINHQTSIFEVDNAHHLFLEFDVPAVTGPFPGGELLVKPTPRTYETFAFSGNVLDGIDHRLVPEELESFETIDGGDNRVAPATQGDVFIWIQGNQRDEVFARGLVWTQVLNSSARLKREEHGFLFRDSRDLTGFIDGSANPRDNMRLEAALIPSNAYAGGSFVLTQRWQHDLQKFHALSVEAQEGVIGRTKKSSIELDEERMPPNSHVSRTDIKRDGKAVKIYRRSTPTGGVSNPGLFFLAFSADLRRFKWLLDSMYGNSDDGINDRLLEYSKPLSSSFYFAPNVRALNRIFA